MTKNQQIPLKWLRDAVAKGVLVKVTVNPIAAPAAIGIGAGTTVGAMDSGTIDDDDDDANCPDSY